VNLYEAAFGFGLVSMSVIAIAAVGFTMQFGITNMINLAYGEVMISSAYVAYYLNRAGISIWVGMVAGALFGAVFSFLLNRVVYGPFQRKGTSLIGMVIVSLAVSLMIANLLLPIVGPFSVSYQNTGGSLVRISNITLTTDQIAIIGLAVVLMLLIHGLLRYTRLGKAMRATAANPTLARNCGIPTQRVVDVVWLITGALCGLAGVVAALNSDSFAIANGAAFLIPIIAAAVLGGAGQPYGAMIGAVTIGMVTELSAAAWSPEYKEVVAFGILVLVMVLRPQGLLAKRGALAAAG
jgi:branched-subunit amino acid ABC-type transport system permease component